MWCRSISTSYAPLLERHRTYFRSGRTRSAAWRNAQLEALEALVTERAAAFHDALWKDLRRNRVDADVTDVQFIADEAAYARRRLRGWMRPLRRGTPLFMKPGHVEVRFEPFGVGLIVGAWNYPLMLTLSPLVAAICGGNAAVVKPSEVAPACAEAIARLLPRYLDPDAFSVVTGGVPETTALLAEQWDHIFFTGGPAVGKIVMTAAAAHLTPVVLELGGKNPAFVDRSAKVRVAARRIAQGRWTNAGQTCTAPDYVLVDRPVAAALLQELKAAAVGFYGPDPRASPDYGRIVSAHHFERLLRLLEGAEVYHGGEYVREELYLAPTILTRVAPDAPAMREEIFGPILPVIEVDGPGDALAHIDAGPDPLGFYVFAEDGAVVERMLAATRSGDAAVNDCTLQPLIRELPFGGVGNSGMGKYHGEWGFRAYTNARGVLHRPSRPDPAVRYPPYRRYARLRAWLLRADA